ncbi:OPA3-like protein [Cocos nucifera]|uniref:OPA3-like protein n=1 Tax=Cocos nucifera TaxID=13894 RepID=A0A8K0IAL8_COCNU|nr:OPA3-like protein [Cocos nucifera]
MVLPVVKLGSLALRTLSKPIASRLKQQAGFHPRFREFIINLAQVNHRFTTTMQRRLYNHSTDTAIRPLNEERAVQAAVDLLGELFIFSVVFIPKVYLFSLSSDVNFNFLLLIDIIDALVAGAALIFEVQRSARSEARKEESRKQELEALKQKEENLAREVELLKQKLHELEHLAQGRGPFSIPKFRSGHAPESMKPMAAA